MGRGKMLLRNFTSCLSRRAIATQLGQFSGFNNGKYATAFIRPNCTSSSSNEGPLEGIRVLDLTRILAGPYCTMIMGDLGAEIIKVEKPGTGDDTRHWGTETNDLTYYFVCVNRNKKSIALDLTRGRHVLLELAKKSDICIENFVPGTMEKLGIGYDVLSSINPKLIYCSITGFGTDGPYAKRGGYDVIAASIGGLLNITGPRDGEPCKVGVAMTDLATGLYAHGAIMAALLQRFKTNKGQRIDCNLLSTQIASLANLGSNYINNGVEARRWGTAHETIVPYESFPTKDGRWITVGAGNNTLFAAFCKLLDLPELTTDARFCSNALRVQNRQVLIDKISSKMQEKSCDEWLDVFQGSKLPYGPVNDMAHTFNDPQVKHNNLVHNLGPYKVVGPAVTFSESLNKPRSPPPRLGEHTREILGNVLQLSTAEMDKLFAKKIVE